MFPVFMTPFRKQYKMGGRVIDWFYSVIYGIYTFHRILLETISNPTRKRENVCQRPRNQLENQQSVCTQFFSVDGI